MVWDCFAAGGLLAAIDGNINCTLNGEILKKNAQPSACNLNITALLNNSWIINQDSDQLQRFTSSQKKKRMNLKT